MGRIHRGLDTANGRMVAIKMPRTGGDVEVASLLREAATLRTVQHAGIVKVWGDGTWDSMPWIAMELLEGRTLLEEMQRVWEGKAGAGGGSKLRPRSEELPTIPVRPHVLHRARMNTPRAARPRAAAGRFREASGVVTQLAAILDHIHARGYVHRDVKPSNVFLREGRVTLIDFGLACRAGTERPMQGREGLCVGTVQYAAPEQITGDAVDARTDVYSLGCVLYELVTGLRPFDGESTNEVAQKHLHRDPAPPSELVSELPGQLEDLLLEMLAKRPADRPATAGAAAARFATLVARLSGVADPSP
jgi:serine/threonine protein kinase